MTKKILITGFEASEEEARNVSGELAKLVASEMKDEEYLEVKHLLLPVSKDAYEPVLIPEVL